MRGLKYFMWGYQPHFQSIASSRAEDLLGEFDADFNASMFLVGVLESKRDDRIPVCVEPQDSRYQEQLNGLPEEAARLANVDPDRMCISNPLAADRYERSRQLHHLQEAIRRRVSSLSDDKVRVFCSFPVKVEDYLVTCVLRVDREAFDLFPRLERDTIGRCQVATSFLGSCIEELLKDCSQLLKVPDPGLELGGFRSVSDIFRAAGHRLMETPAFAVGKVDALGVAFEACNTIASLRYEKEEGRGRMVFADPSHPNVESLVTLLEPVELRQYRSVRKLLQMASGGLSLLSDGKSIYGLGRELEGYDRAKEDLFVVEFIKHHDWEFRHAGHAFMRVLYGEPSPPRTAFREQKFRSDARRIFAGLSEESLDKLSGLARAASRQKHGTMLLVTTIAEQEASRLGKQSTRINPVQVTEEVLGVLTSIDGAVILDTSATCHAIGAILDGRASPSGNPGRGARFNSAVRYVDGSEAPCMAVIVSEDGTVDVVPDLRPQIRKAALVEAMQELRGLAAGTEPNRARFNGVMGWFRDHRFYLSEEDCVEINRLRRDIESRFPTDSVRIVYNDLSPHPEMNESYLISPIDPSS